MFGEGNKVCTFHGCMLEDKTKGATVGEGWEETENQMEVVVTNKKVTETKHRTTQDGKISAIVPPG
jgi:hypothetical protein